MKLRIGCFAILLVSLALTALGQQTTSNSSTTVPQMIPYAGIARAPDGKPLTGTVGMTFALYKDEQGGAPLWLETQNVQPDKAGQYSVTLGSTNSHGLPAELFTSGEARWLGVQAQGQPEQPRTLLLSVPYAMKAVDAETVGGLPASAFVRAAVPADNNQPGANGPTAPGNGPGPAVSGSGTTNYVPLWTNNNGTLGNSVLFQKGTGSTAKIGINTTTPASTLDVKGGSTVRGLFSLPASGTATSSTGYNSQAMKLTASAFNSGAGTAVAQNFQWQAEPVGNNTNSPAGTLNLLFGQGTNNLAETGLNIASNGQITFAAGQTFPGTGTVTSVGSGAGLTGGPITTSGTLSLDTTYTDTRYAQLAANNLFSTNQAISAASGTGLIVAGGTTGVSGHGTAYGVYGYTYSGDGLLGDSQTGYGLVATSDTGTGVYATSNQQTGVYGQGVTGVAGVTRSSNGLAGDFNNAAGGQSLSAKVNGLEMFGVYADKVLLPASGTATAATGYNSQPLDSVASAYDSGRGQAETQTFRWESEPVGNNTGSPTGKLNLLFGANGATPAETGLSVANNGQITFATGQTFPGSGTITGVTAGTDLTGGGSSGNVILNVDTTKVVTGVTAGTDLTGGGTGGNVTLNLNTAATDARYAQLAANNTFTGNQTVNGNVSAAGLVTGSGFNIGLNPFAFGSYSYANAFLGFAGNATMTGTGNTASGVGALYSNTTGSHNTASGDGALQYNTTGSENTANGDRALVFNTTGSYNNASGWFALYSNTTGNYNTASGEAALSYNTTGNYNTASGAEALYSNTTGSDNTAHGYLALLSNTTGSYNTASGDAALRFNTTGTDNTASGDAALLYNTTGYYNTANGGDTLYSNTTGNVNTASGFMALYSNTTGGGNTASGYEALYSNTTGSYNTAVGLYALNANTTGSYLTCVGYRCTPGADGLRNATAIGAHAVVGESNALVLGGTGQYAVKVGIGTTTPSNILTIAQGAGHPLSDGWATFSSRRWKTNIQTLHGALGKVERLRGVSYDLKANGQHEVGVIAEEVGAVVPEVVTWEKNGKDAQSVDYGRLTALLIEATKEQQALIHKQQAQIKAQQAQINAQQAQIGTQQTQISSQQKQNKVQQARIDRLTSHVNAIQASLEANRRTNSLLRTGEAQVSMVHQ